MHPAKPLWGNRGAGSATIRLLFPVSRIHPDEHSWGWIVSAIGPSNPSRAQDGMDKYLRIWTKAWSLATRAVLCFRGRRHVGTHFWDRHPLANLHCLYSTLYKPLGQVPRTSTRCFDNVVSILFRCHQRWTLALAPGTPTPDLWWVSGPFTHIITAPMLMSS